RALPRRGAAASVLGSRIPAPRARAPQGDLARMARSERRARLAEGREPDASERPRSEQALRSKRRAGTGSLERAVLPRERRPERALRAQRARLDREPRAVLEHRRREPP